MMFLAIDSAGWVAIIAALSAAVGSFFTMWKTLQTNKKVEEVKHVAVETLKLTNGNMAAALEINVTSAQALAVAQPTTVNVEKVTEATKKLVAHNTAKNSVLESVTGPAQQA